MAPKNVHLFARGGTIAMLPDPAGGLQPGLSGSDLARLVPGLDGMDLTVTDLGGVPSAELTFGDIAHIAGLAQAAIADGACGVVVSQGTDTIEETSFLLELLLPRQVPVVITGAMRGTTQLGSDAGANLSASIRLAASPVAQGRGVVVVMNDEIHAPRFVRKGHVAGLGAFTSEPLGPLGWVHEDRVVLLMDTPPMPQLTWCDPPPPVAIVEIGFDMELGLLKAINPSEIGGIVVAGLGAGHVPSRAVAILAEFAKHVPVILASRTGQGGPLVNSYGFAGGERDLLSKGLVSAGWLHPRKARILLSALLSGRATRDGIVRTFTSLYEPISQVERKA